jgi:4-amino-4-deoxy-L-arabinose transferase-like glycosyltransferase
MRSGRVHLALVVALLLAGTTLRAANLGGPAFCCDEFYHVFAARNWLAGEGLWAGEREYARARLTTYMTIGAFALVGEGEAAARLPALVFGVATMALTYAVGRSLAGPLAGLVALALIAVSPHAVDVSRFARLYSQLTFFSLLAVFAAFRALDALEAGPLLTRRRVGWALVAGAATLLAAHFHPVALALGPAVLLYAALRATLLAAGRDWAGAARHAALAAALALAAAAALATPALRDRVVDVALTPLPWYRPMPGDAWTYHAHLADRYLWLWFLVWPASVVFALAWQRAGLFLACAFWVPFLIVSALVATKQSRYVMHLLPLAWLILGGSAEVVWPATRAALLAAVARTVPASPGWLRSLLGASVLFVALAPLLRVTPSIREALGRPFQTTGSFTTGSYQEWRELARRLGPKLPPDAVIVSTTWHAPIYYLNRPTRHMLPAFRHLGQADWETPVRDGSRQVQRAEHLTTVRASGLPVWVVLRRSSWEREGYLDDGLKRLVQTDCRREPLPGDSTFVAFDCGTLWQTGKARR